MIDCLHAKNEFYAGLDIRCVVIDNEKNLYLSPYFLDYQLKNDDFSRAYYPPEILDQINMKVF